jgi:GT2 family glycosyltransferase
MLGRAFQRAPSDLRQIRIVVATRLSEKEFWRRSAAGRSLGLWKKDANLEVIVLASNQEGLPAIYNRQIADAVFVGILVFMHDDVWIDDHAFLEKIRVALVRYDVVGVAGNKRLVPGQPAWLFKRGDPVAGFEYDGPNLSGQVGHGRPGQCEMSVFGPTPAACELLDGVFLAIRANYVRESKVFFDERFTFDFYDMDFCRTARRAGLLLGTWPINLIHESVGDFASAGWRRGLEIYRKKWRQ